MSPDAESKFAARVRNMNQGCGSDIWRPLITAVLFLAISTARISLAQENSPEGDSRVLETITSTAAKLDLEAPRAGELMFRPILNYSNRWMQDSLVKSVTIYLSPVVETDTGTVERYTGIDSPDYSVQFRVLRQVGGTKKLVRPQEYREFAADIPGGTYAISRISYTYERRFLLAPKTVTFCLSDGTGVFEVENGKSIYLGILSIDDLKRLHFKLVRILLQ